MRRIIKRTITIVTTITWTISWQPKHARPANDEAQPPMADPPELSLLAEGEPGPWEIEATLTKEVEVSEIKATSTPVADQPPDTLYYQNLPRKEINS
jgi:hypothetical protein